MGVAETLAESFLNLEDDHLRNLAWHVRQRTPVCCGPRAILFTDLDGAG